MSWIGTRPAEWAIMTYGNCRITVLDAEGRPFIADVKEGDVWYFPPSAPHSLQGTQSGDIGRVKRNLSHYVENVGDTDVQFVGVFRSSRYEGFSLTDWLTHTPPKLMAQHLNIDEATIAKWPDNSPDVRPKSSKRDGYKRHHALTDSAAVTVLPQLL